MSFSKLFAKRHTGVFYKQELKKLNHQVKRDVCRLSIMSSVNGHLIMQGLIAIAMHKRCEYICGFCDSVDYMNEVYNWLKVLKGDLKQMREKLRQHSFDNGRLCNQYGKYLGKTLDETFWLIHSARDIAKLLYEVVKMLLSLMKFYKHGEKKAYLMQQTGWTMFNGWEAAKLRDFFKKHSTEILDLEIQSISLDAIKDRANKQGIDFLGSQVEFQQQFLKEPMDLIYPK